jgi:predicted SprT family Zn-dependent metalloprotease
MNSENTTRDTDYINDWDNYLDDELFFEEELNKQYFENHNDIEEFKTSTNNTINILSSQNSENDFDVYEYFALYNEMYFDGKLGGVRLEWSKRMTTCAGIFYAKHHEYVIRLSEPLLKFRAIKEVKETLLHEMIHAWVQIENLDQSDDQSGHGYNFKSKMYEVNKSTGFNITVYHTFHDEVDYHKKHVWRCDGQCQKKAPYFGLVKRAMNRAPGKNDFWWQNHEETCGGKFTKIQGDQLEKKELKVNPKISNKTKKETLNTNKNNTGKEPEDVRSSNNKSIKDFFKIKTK